LNCLMRCDNSRNQMDAISKQMVGMDEDKGMLIDGRLLRQGDIIYDLVDVLEDNNAPGDRDDREIIVIDGRVYERVINPGEKVFDLTDVVEESSRDDVARRVAEIAERVAREIIPDIAERVIREEIEKLKG
jgi:L-fucose mutarotase/ribose pyranase (RbsD/FucU family)